MKRIGIAAAAAIMTIAPLGATAASAQQYRGDRHDRYDRNDHRDNRRAERWDQRRHNGYYANGRFYYGQPTYAHQRAGDYRPAWQQWRRGDRLPNYARSHYREVDWRRERLRQPPRGYHYVRDDRGETLLVGLATGVILGIIASQ